MYTLTPFPLVVISVVLKFDVSAEKVLILPYWVGVFVVEVKVEVEVVEGICVVFPD